MFKGVHLNDRKLIGTLYNKHGIKTCEINNLCGHRKEFDDYGQLKFRGTYSNCEKNGHGKEYYSNGILKFEGEYLNGKRHGKGKKYYRNGKLKFEGKYLNDKEWEGIGYDSLNNKIYELKGGQGLIIKYNRYDNTKIKFESEYSNGERNGKGKEYGYDGK